MEYYTIKLRYSDEENNAFPRLLFDGKSSELEWFQSLYSFDQVHISTTLNKEIQLNVIYDQDSEIRKLNDFVDWIGVLNTFYEVVSSRTMKILSTYALGEHSFQIVKVNLNGNFLDYYVFQSLNPALKILDYKQSVFTEWRRKKLGKNYYQFNDFSDYQDLNKSLKAREDRLRLGLEKLVLNEKIDFF
ncbi:MAG: hypothetical protein AAFQ94_27770 [Bacteroidota bacterium]